METIPHHQQRDGDVALNLTPAFHAQMRKLKPTSAIFNLVSTIMGGGVLSLPFAMSYTGIILGVVLLILCALLSDFSVYILVAAARKSGSESYEEVANAVGGAKAKNLVIFLVFSLTWLCCVAYILLFGSLIKGSIITFDEEASNSTDVETYSKIFGTLGVLPLCFYDKLHALQYTSFVSIISVVVLVIAIVVRTIQDGQGFKHPDSIKWFPDSLGEVVYALPFYCIAYLCHFNVLPMHCELRRPTISRMKRVIHFTMGIPAILYITAGIFGYLKGLDVTCQVVLKNFDNKDPLIAAGRVGLSFTLLFSFPLIVLPCRDSLNRIILMIRSNCCKNTFNELEEPLIHSDDEATTETRENTNSEDLDNSLVLGGTVSSTCDGFPRANGRSYSASELSIEDVNLKARLLSSTVHRIVTTIGIVGSALFLACSVDGIAVIWSFMGSTVSLVIAFILPAWFYLSLCPEKSIYDRNKFCAWLLLVTGILLLIICTVEAVVHVHDKSC